MRSILAIILLLFSFNANADQISANNISDINCTAGNAVGVSNFSYNPNSGVLSAFTMSIFGPSIQTYEIQSVDASTKFGTTNFEIGKISFKSTNTANPLTYVIVTNNSLAKGSGTYTATWGTVIAGSPFGGPVGLAPIANLVCAIEVL